MCFLLFGMDKGFVSGQKSAPLCGPGHTVGMSSFDESSGAVL